MSKDEQFIEWWNALCLYDQEQLVGK